jgi:hypothetical protein
VIKRRFVQLLVPDLFDYGLAKFVTQMRKWDPRQKLADKMATENQQQQHGGGEHAGDDDDGDYDGEYDYGPEGGGDKEDWEEEEVVDGPGPGEYHHKNK